MFTNDTARWILLAASVRTLQTIAISIFTNDFFQKTYPEYDLLYQRWSTISTLAGAFFCTIATAVICDFYDYEIYMTKAYICIGCSLISIPCTFLIFMVQDNFAISMFGLFVEYLLSTGWGQPAIGILSAVVDQSIRGTAIGVFFFLISVFGILAPQSLYAIQNHYGLDPKEEPIEFGWLCTLSSVIPCLLSVPCFYMAGVRYSWYRFNEAIFIMDRFDEEAQLEWDEVTRK